MIVRRSTQRARPTVLNHHSHREETEPRALGVDPAFTPAAMCPMRIWLLFFSGIVAGYLAWTTVFLGGGDGVERQRVEGEGGGSVGGGGESSSSGSADGGAEGKGKARTRTTMVRARAQPAAPVLLGVASVGSPYPATRRWATVEQNMARHVGVSFPLRHPFSLSPPRRARTSLSSLRSALSRQRPCHLTDARRPSSLPSLQSWKAWGLFAVDGLSGRYLYNSVCKQGARGGSGKPAHIMAASPDEQDRRKAAGVKEE